MISGYALGVAIASPVFALLTGRMPRRPLMIALMGIFVVGNVLCALATTYWMLLGARLLVACCHGLFFGVALVLAMRLAPKDRPDGCRVPRGRGRQPCERPSACHSGAAIGQAYGWRTTFWVIAVAPAPSPRSQWRSSCRMPEEDRQEKSDPCRRNPRAAMRPTVLLAYTSPLPSL